MKKTRRTRTTVEKHELIVVRRPRKPGRTLCKECSEAVALVTLDEAVKISGLSSRAIYRLIEEERIHFVEAAAEIGLICPTTLLNSSKSSIRHTQK
ncbi:MAG TPA: hypothetical protein VKN18_30280 [Blastocatellia bacterium]|nr:hypothetical protein [Blastocatellia bacterium]